MPLRILPFTDDASISVSDCLSGPSGSGKSTLLKLCMGLYSPTRGAVFVGGSNVRLVSAEHLRAQIGWVAQGDGSVLPGE